jgi:hypothetical protein
MNEGFQQMTEYQSPTLPEPIDAAGLLQGATPGPWTGDPHGGFIWAASEKGGSFTVGEVMGWGYFTGHGHGALGLSNDEAEKRQRANQALLAAAPALAAEVVRLREENERLRNTVGAQETSIAAVDNWLLEHGDTTHLLSRVEHLDAFMAFAAEQAVSTLKAAAERMAEGLEALIERFDMYLPHSNEPHSNVAAHTRRMMEEGRNAAKAYRAATSGAG